MSSRVSDVEKASTASSKGKNEIDVITDARFVREKDEGVEEAYLVKSELVNACLQKEIGFGKYQLGLFLLSGFGWLSDNLWLQGVAIILPQIDREFHPQHFQFITMALYVGLIIGATTWGVLADVIGRRWSWNLTLGLSGIFGIAAGAAPNFTALGGLIACLGFGVGGNLPVDGAVFLEHIPQSHQWLLTLLSAFWSLGQLIASLIAWAFIANFSCDPNASVCRKEDNMGWRYTMYTLGALTFVMFLFRFVIFNLQESSKFLLAKGDNQKALAVLEYVAKKNGKKITLTLEQLDAVDRQYSNNPNKTGFTNAEIFKRAFSSISLSHVRPLFSSPRLAVNTSLTILCWGLIGLAYPLFNAFLPVYLSERNVGSSDSISATYRQYTIVSVLGIPGSIIACYLVEITRGKGRWTIGGRKYSMAVATALTGIFLFLFTTAKDASQTLAYSCVTSLTQNAMYGVLYAYTPEVFPAPHRGTGDAICSAFNRITGLMAPIIAIYATASANGPVFVAAALFLVSSVAMILLPIETAGKAAL